MKFTQILMFLWLAASFQSSWKLPRRNFYWRTVGLKSSYSWSKVPPLMTVLPNCTCNLRACVARSLTRFRATLVLLQSLRLRFNSCRVVVLKSNDRKVTFLSSTQLFMRLVLNISVMTSRHLVCVDVWPHTCFRFRGVFFLHLSHFWHVYFFFFFCTCIIPDFLQLHVELFTTKSSVLHCVSAACRGWL